jgi:4-hydroxyphenylacetaldehyde oxime monooxygenase
VDKLLGDLRRIGPKPVALDEHIFGLADGIVGTVAFGNIYGTEQFAHKKHFQHILNEAMEMLASFSAEDFFPNIAGRLVDRLAGVVARRERIFKELDAFYEMVIDQHMDPTRAKPENGGDLVVVLIDLWKEQRGGTFLFTRNHVKAMIMVSCRERIKNAAISRKKFQVHAKHDLFFSGTGTCFIFRTRSLGESRRVR